jgi:hypothetical protein
MNASDASRENVELAFSFPTSIRKDALIVLSTFPESSHRSKTFKLQVEGEIVSIPQRIYHDPAQIDTRRLTSIQRELADSLLTRHHDGFIRQYSLSRIIFSKGLWIPPFVVQLVGEYVVEILSSIQTALPRLDRVQYRSFVDANPAFLARTQQRAISYWNCYYRHRYHWNDYPGKQILDFLNQC